jgi:hypothetical protein
MNYGTTINGQHQWIGIFGGNRPESNIKRHDLQIICGNSQAEAIAATIID